MEKSYPAWQWVTADRIVSHEPCELLFAYLVPSAAGADASLYDGYSTGGKLIATLEQAAKTSHPFRPPEPVFCAQGLFADIGTSVTGLFVMYRVIKGWKEAEE